MDKKLNKDKFLNIYENRDFLLNLHKNDLIDNLLCRYYATYRCTLETYNYVPERHNRAILALIFKDFKRDFKKVGKLNKFYQKRFKKKFLKLVKEYKREKKKCN